MRRPTLWALTALIILFLTPMAAQAQDPGGAYGPGETGLETTRVVEATDSPGVVASELLADTVGTDGAVGPVSTLSVAGTQVGGEIEELRVDADGVLSVNTELPAAAVLGDATANPTAPAVGSFLMGWDNGGGVWGRVRQNAGRLEVDLDLVGGSQLSIGQQVMASSIPVVIAPDQTDVPANITQVGGTAATVDQGPSTAGTLRVVHAQPDAIGLEALLAVTQTAGVTFTIPAGAGVTTCQNRSVEAIGVHIGSMSATLGLIMGAGAATNDGTAGKYTTELQGVVLHFYDLDSVGPAAVYCTSDTL